MVELRHLRYFLAVAEENSFTRAAQRLRVSQPTLSQQIKALERAVGGRLFERGPGGAHLTPAGRALLAPARHAISVVRDGLRAAAEIVAATTAALRVGLIYGGAGAITQPILSAFNRACPGIGLRFRAELPVSHAYTALLQDEIDIAFTRLPLHPELHAWTELYHERRVLVLHESHCLAGESTLTLAQVLPLTMLASTPERMPPEVRDHWLLNDFRNGQQANRFRTEAWTVPEVAQTIVHNPGVVAMCSEIARRFPPAPGAPLRFVDLPEAGPSVAVVAWRNGDDRPQVTAFRELAARYAGSGLVPGLV